MKFYPRTVARACYVYCRHCLTFQRPQTRMWLLLRKPKIHLFCTRRAEYILKQNDSNSIRHQNLHSCFYVQRLTSESNDLPKEKFLACCKAKQSSENNFDCNWPFSYPSRSMTFTKFVQLSEFKCSAAQQSQHRSIDVRSSRITVIRPSSLTGDPSASRHSFDCLTSRLCIYSRS